MANAVLAPGGNNTISVEQVLQYGRDSGIAFKLVDNLQTCSLGDSSGPASYKNDAERT